MNTMQITVLSGPDSGASIVVGQAGVIVGRESTCDLILQDSEVSREHAAFWLGPGNVLLVRDMGSTNGTFVNNGKIAGDTVLQDGQQVRVGNTTLLAQQTAMMQQPAGSVAPAATGLKSNRTLLTIIAAVVGLVVLVGVIFLVAGGGGGPASLPEIIDQAKESTVMIVSCDASQVECGQGTGWSYDADSHLVVTNAHVVNDNMVAAMGSRIVLQEGNFYDAKVVGVAPCEDLAVLRVDSLDGLETMPLGSQSDIRQGDQAIVIGYPGTLTSAITEGSSTNTQDLVANEGIVSVVQSEVALTFPYGAITLPNVIQTDAPINHGNSGGPLLDDNGHLIGVNTLGDASHESEGFAIGVDRVKEIVPKLVAGEDVC